MSNIRVIGIGNPLMGDDGIGIAAVDRLRQLDLPPDVEAIDGGTGGLTLLTLIEGARRIILIDAVAMGKTAGSFACFGLDELMSADHETLFSVHQSGALPALRLGSELGLLPPLSLYGIQPAVIAFGQGLSPAVNASLDPLLSALLADLSKK